MNLSAAEPVATGPTPDIASILTRQRAAFLRDGPPELAQRRADLDRLKQAILQNRARIEAAIKADFGHRSSHETVLFELMTVVEGIRYMRRRLRRWMKPQRRHVPLHFQPARAWVQYQPVGVVGIMSPWNYPFSLALMPLATALAAGNRAMLKPSEFTPATSALLAELLAGAFDEERVAVVLGAAEVGAEFSAQPFDHLMFTGSTNVGRAVMRSAAANLVPVTLELGGKSPAVIAPGAAVAAAEAIAWGKLANAGQTCIAPDYVLLHPDEIEPFAEAYDAAVRRLYPQGPASPDYSSIINARHFERLKTMQEDAASRGARVRAVGNPPDAAAQRPLAMAPSLIIGADDQARVMQEEIFGPILPLRPCAGVREAIDVINAGPRPLALYYFGPPGREREELLARTASGNVTINNTLLHYAQDDLPFGGIGDSGMGAYHGFEGFQAMSHARGILAQGRWNLARLLRPPFGRLADLVIRVMLR